MDLADQSGQPLAAQLCRGDGLSLVFVVVLTADAKDFAAAVYRSPGVDESVVSPGRAFWAGLVLTQVIALKETAPVAGRQNLYGISPCTDALEKRTNFVKRGHHLTIGNGAADVYAC